MKRALVSAGRFLRRWHRFAIPLVLVLSVTVVTMVMHALQSDDVSDPDFLNPASSAPIGGATLARQLYSRGVTVLTEDGANAALITAEGGDATVFIPAPSLMNEHQLGFLRLLPESDTIVLVAPDGSTVSEARLPVNRVSSHWSTQVAQPDCDDPTATGAGAAGIDGFEYQGSLDKCYRGALARLHGEQPQIWLVGASDVFRNDRFGEVDNHTLALDLLDKHRRLIWLNIHDPEPPPQLKNVPVGDSESPDFINVNGNAGDDYPSGNGDAGGQSGGRGHDSGQGNSGSDASSEPSIAAIFPPWVWAAVALVALVAVALALAAGRRMGPPVTEPMPVTARLRESVEGRGRLYRRARQPAVALDVLRRAAISSLPGLLGEPESTPVMKLLEKVAERTGLPREQVDAILRDDHPKDNAQLLASVQRLDELMTRLNDTATGPAAGSRGHQRTGRT
jgi:hypothetical protein